MSTCLKYLLKWPSYLWTLNQKSNIFSYNLPTRILPSETVINCHLLYIEILIHETIRYERHILFLFLAQCIVLFWICNNARRVCNPKHLISYCLLRPTHMRWHLYYCPRCRHRCHVLGPKVTQPLKVRANNGMKIEYMYYTLLFINNQQLRCGEIGSPSDNIEIMKMIRSFRFSIHAAIKRIETKCAPNY